VSAVMLVSFELLSPQKNQSATPIENTGWIRALPMIMRTKAIYPILMVGLGACVFGGLLTFQTSLVRGTGLTASTFFAAYAITVVASRFLLAPIIGRANGNRAAIILLLVMTAGVVVAFGFNLGVLMQIISAVLLGVGYGLVYSVIQTQAVNDAPPEYRNAALTWFVIAYFLGIFGFPVFGGWLIVTSGKQWFLVVVLAFAVAETALAFIRNSVGNQRKPATV
jgi:MFS family permease